MVKKPVMVWEVTTDGPCEQPCYCRRFRTFEAAEAWARKIVAASVSDRFATSAEITGPGEWATVRLDGNNRVWTDMGTCAPLKIRICEASA